MRLHTYPTLFLLFVALIFLTACGKETIRGEGPVVSQIRSVATFTQLDVPINAQVYLTQGDTQQVRVEAQQNILSVMQTPLNGPALSFNFGNHRIDDYEPIRIYITVAELSEISVSGSGQVTSNSSWTVGNLNLVLSGSGDISLPLNGAQQINTRLSGSGSITLRGTRPINIPFRFPVRVRYPLSG